MGLAWAAYAGLTWCLLIGDFLRRRGPVPAPGSAAAPYELGRLSLGQIVDRSVAVSTVTLPRFLGDPAAHLVAAYWLVPALVCAYVFLEPMLAPRPRTAFWLVTGVILLPWGAGLSPHWPAFQ